MLVQVTAPHFTAGIELDDAGVVTRAPPILLWAVGRNRVWLRDYFQSKGWKAVVVKDAGQ